MTISDMVVPKSGEIVFDGFRGFLKFTFFRGFFKKIIERYFIYILYIIQLFFIAHEMFFLADFTWNIQYFHEKIRNYAKSRPDII